MKAMMVLFVFQAMFLGSARQAPATQEPPKSDAAPPPSRPVKPVEVRVYPIRHALAHEAASVLSKVFRTAQFTADERTNSVIVSTSEDELKRVEAMVTTLDVPMTEASAAETRVLSLGNRPANDLLMQLQAVLLSRAEFRDGRVAADNARNKLILRGSREFLNQAEGVVKAVDLPAESVQLEFAFFQATTGDGGGAQVPQDLADVAKELARFGRIELLGRLSTVAVEGETFEIEGRLGASISATTQGRILKATPEGVVRLSIEAGLDMQRAPHPEETKKPPQDSSFRTSTTISTRRGDTLVLGAAPAGWERGSSAILVVRVGG